MTTGAVSSTTVGALLLQKYADLGRKLSGIFSENGIAITKELSPEDFTSVLESASPEIMEAGKSMMQVFRVETKELCATLQTMHYNEGNGIQHRLKSLFDKHDTQGLCEEEKKAIWQSLNKKRIALWDEHNAKWDAFEEAKLQSMSDSLRSIQSTVTI